MNERQETTTRDRDYGFYAILLLVLAVVAWLLSLPFCPFVQRASLNRFHLQTESFALWAAQQPVPAMYNFYNRYEISPSPWKDDASGEVYWERGTANHFPLRLFTFGDDRAIFLRPSELRRIDIWSSYRGQELHTLWIATPSPRGGFDLTCELIP